VYLDQFAISNLVFSNEEIWKDLKLLLEQGVKEGKLRCPIPYDHFLETPQAEPEKAKKIDDYFSSISNGLVFKSTFHITSQLIISMLRKNNLTVNTFIGKLKKEKILSEKREFDFFYDRKQEFDQMIAEGANVSNSFRNITHNQKIEKKTKKTMYDAIYHISTQEFVARLKDLIKDGNIVIRGDSFSFMDIPNWIDQTIFRLINIHRMDVKETKKLLSIIQEYGFSKIAPLDIRFSLYAIMSIESKKENAGDHIDIERIAAGLLISDYFLIDRQRKSEIIELVLDKKYQTKVYSGCKLDILSLINELKMILN